MLLSSSLAHLIEDTVWLFVAGACAGVTDTGSFISDATLDYSILMLLADWSWIFIADSPSKFLAAILSASVFLGELTSWGNLNW